MKDLRQSIREALEGDFTVIGIRGSNYELKIGEELETSYVWDHMLEESTKYSDEPQELGGVSATNANCPTVFGRWGTESDDIEDQIDAIIEGLEFHKETYNYKYIYLISGSGTNVSASIDDYREIIVEDAVVLAELGRRE